MLGSAPFLRRRLLAEEEFAGQPLATEERGHQTLVPSPEDKRAAALRGQTTLLAHGISRAES